MDDGSKQPRILAVASGGGHWMQLMRLRDAFLGGDMAFVATHFSDYRKSIPPGARFYLVTDANKKDWLRGTLLICELFWIILRERPDVVISTGAAPGYFALRLGRLLGARTIWVDSIANVGRMSLSGRLVRRYADLWLTQWEHLARPKGPHYIGAVL
ncbi:MAG: UDP-N-acetylglucosamine--LPS N-acetylglucosamine transferase [Pseudomonadota bacterium]|jgi:UDP-N-acetylglucosamine:LPS N-acetylglucosamine transferase